MSSTAGRVGEDQADDLKSYKIKREKMNYHQNNTNLLLEQYLDGDLSVEDANRLKALLEADPALREELDAMKLAIEAARHKGLYARVKAIRNEMLSEHSHVQPARRFSLVRRSMRIAASLLLLAGVFAIYKYVSVTPASLYNDLYLQYEPVRTRSIQADPAETAYRQQNWKEVITLADRNPNNNKNLFLAGIASMETGNFPVAAGRFENILQKN